jgi:hypothetical protein
MLSRRDFMWTLPAGLILSRVLGPLDSLAAQDMQALGFDTAYKQINADGSEIICFTEVDLLGGLVPGDRATTVLADQITLSGTLRKSGLDLTLLAREIVCSNGATIDVSGGPPKTTHQPGNPGDHAANGLSAGDAGQPGGSGSGGNRGGNIKIYAQTIKGSLAILSKGGDGGNAQDGGNGAKGPSGTPWTTNNPTATGGNGGKGGAAGAAGTPGDGGNGGAIIVNTLDGSFANVLVSSVAGGNAGAPASNGTPGDPGDPGSGGSGQIQVYCPPPPGRPGRPIH